MISRLFIWLIEHPAQTYTWGVEKFGAFESMPDKSLTEISHYLHADPNEPFEVVVLLPGDTVFSNVITVPEQQAKYLQQSLPYLVEEQLTEDVTDMYFVLGQKVTHNQYSVAGITRTTLERHLTYLQQAHIQPHVIVADCSCCPDNTVMMTAKKTLLQLAAHQAYSIDSENTVDVVSHYLVTTEHASVTWMMETQIASQASSWLELIKKTSSDKSVTFTKQTIDSTLQVLAQQYKQNPSYYKAINFLQGKYARKIARKTPLHRWHQVILVIAAVAALQLLFDVTQGVYLSVKTHQLENQNKVFYKTLFPNDTVTDNFKAQMVGKLKNANVGGAKNSFLDTYSRVVTVINTQHLQSSLDVVQVSFNDEKGEIRLDLLAKSFEQLTQLKDLLAKDELQAEIGSATTEAGKTKASLKIWQ